MELLKTFLDFFLHLDHHMGAIVNEYGLLSYVILFMIIFCETGLVITPFLPGDSLLFILGALAAKGALRLDLLFVLLSVAAILGDSVNYSIGRMLAPKVFNNERIPFLKKAHLVRTQEFYAKHGTKTIIIARFLPIVRTFAPFLAGVAEMPYAKFMLYNVLGGLLWVVVGLVAGYLFGNLPFVEENFSLVILAIIVISLLPAAYEFFKHRKT